jgi:hypothetical protein
MDLTPAANMNRSELAPQRLCESCTKAPADVDGHDGLQQFDGPIRHSVPGSVVFECRACHALWSRRYAGEGRFEWTFESPGVGR